MTTPLQANDEWFTQAANGHLELHRRLTAGGEPQIVGDFASDQAAKDALGDSRYARDMQASGVLADRAGLQASGAAYRGQEQASSTNLAPRLGEIVQQEQVFTQAATQLASSGIGIIADVAGGTLNPLSGVLGAGINAAAANNHSGPPHGANQGPSSGQLGPRGVGESDVEQPPSLEHQTPPPAHLRTEARAQAR